MATMRMREALRDAMAEEMRRDEDVFVMGEDVAVSRAPSRSPRDCSTSSAKRGSATPRSPRLDRGDGVGAAMGGIRPVVEIMTVNFALLAMDQIVNHAAAIPYMFGGQVRVPLVIRMPGGAATNSARLTRTASRRSFSRFRPAPPAPPRRRTARACSRRPFATTTP